MPYGLIASLLLVNLADEWFTFLPAGAMESIRADLGLSYAQAGGISGHQRDWQPLTSPHPLVEKAQLH